MIIEIMQEETATIKRYAEGEYVNGYYNEGELAEININGSFQPMPGEEKKQLPESDRKKQLLWFFSETQIKFNDIILRDRDNKEYKVLNVENWPTHGLIHYLATIALRDGQ